MANGYRPMSPRELAEDEWKIDNTHTRQTCPVHKGQQMLMLSVSPRMDVCPLPHDEAGSQEP